MEAAAEAAEGRMSTMDSEGRAQRASSSVRQQRGRVASVGTPSAAYAAGIRAEGAWWGSIAAFPLCQPLIGCLTLALRMTDACMPRIKSTDVGAGERASRQRELRPGLSQPLTHRAPNQTYPRGATHN